MLPHSPHHLLLLLSVSRAITMPPLRQAPTTATLSIGTSRSAIGKASKASIFVLVVGGQPLTRTSKHLNLARPVHLHRLPNSYHWTGEACSQPQSRLAMENSLRCRVHRCTTRGSLPYRRLGTRSTNTRRKRRKSYACSGVSRTVHASHQSHRLPPSY